MSTFAAVASAAAPIIGGIIGNAANRRAQRSTQRHEINMWNMNNAYNTPLQQRKRMVEGGFNPALMYGSGGISNTSSSPARTVPSQADNPAVGLPDAVEAYINYTMMDKQKDLIDANIAQKRQSVITSQKDLQLKDYQLQKLYPATLDDIVARSSFNSFKKDKEEALLPGQLQAQELASEKDRVSIEGGKLSNVGKQLDNWAKEVRNSTLQESVKAELYLMQERVVGAILDNKQKSENISDSQVRRLINLEILNSRRNFGKPQGTAFEHWGKKLYDRVREALKSYR